MSLARSLVRRGLGVSIVPAPAADDRVVARPLQDQLVFPMALVPPAARRESQASVRLPEAIIDWAGAR